MPIVYRSSPFVPEDLVMRYVFAGLMLVGTLADPTTAADLPTATTTISISGMHCGGCALKVSGRLQAVAGVRSVQVDHSTGLATITPQPHATVSPKSLWQAVQKSGYTPKKLVGPSGTFIKLPPS
jgi:copper chaperone CopZ